MSLAAAHLALDAAALQPLWAHIPRLNGHVVTGAEFVALWVKPGRHFNVCHRLTLEEPSLAPLLASACVMDDSEARRQVAQAGVHRPGAVGDCRHCNVGSAEPGLFLQLFPFDYRLPTLAACCDVPHVAPPLAGVVRVTACAPAGYRPGKRSQIAYAYETTVRAYGKLQVESEPGRAFAVHQAVDAQLRERGGETAVASPLRYIESLQLAVVSAAAGESLFDHLRRPTSGPGEGLRAAASALATLHSLAVPGVTGVYGINDEVELVRSWVDLLVQLDPSRRLPLLASRAELMREVPEAEPASAFVHRDFYDKQVLLDGRRVTVLDLDTACNGDPEIDLGNFCAHLCLRGLQREQVALYRDHESVFLSGYGRRVNWARFDWYRRATLLRLVCGYALRPSWRHLSAHLLDAVLADEVRTS